MSENNSIVGLIVALAIVFGLIGAFVSYDLNQYRENPVSKVSKGDNVLISVSQTNNVNNNQVIVNDRFVGKLDKNANVVAIAKDGSMYLVKGGAVLVSDMVVTTNGVDTTVYRVNEPLKLVSSN